MKTFKSLLRLASYHWWAYKKRRQMEPEPVQEKPKTMMDFILPPVVEGKQCYVSLKCNHCGQISLKTAPPNIEEIYDWCPICSRKNHYRRSGPSSFRDIGEEKVLIIAQWIGEGCYEPV